MVCKHEDANFNLEFNRFLDDEGVPRKFTCDLTVYCRHCGAQFKFSNPVISGDRLVLSADIEAEERISDMLDLRDLFIDKKNDE